MIDRVLSNDSGKGLRAVISGTDGAILSTNGSRSLIVRHVVHRNTFRP